MIYTLGRRRRGERTRGKRGRGLCYREGRGVTESRSALPANCHTGRARGRGREDPYAYSMTVIASLVPYVNTQNPMRENRGKETERRRVRERERQGDKGEKERESGSESRKHGMRPMRHIAALVVSAYSNL